MNNIDFVYAIILVHTCVTFLQKATPAKKAAVAKAAKKEESSEDEDSDDEEEEEEKPKVTIHQLTYSQNIKGSLNMMSIPTLSEKL